MSGNWKAIAAMSRNRVIGHQGQVPWDLPEDFRWVKEATSGHTIVMGRKTFESMGKPLPKRTNVVLSRCATNIPGTTVIRELDELDRIDTRGDIWIFGGEEIYRLAMPRTREIYLTLVHREVDGDAFFPPFEDEFEFLGLVKETPDFEIRHYRRPN